MKHILFFSVLLAVGLLTTVAYRSVTGSEISPNAFTHAMIIAAMMTTIAAIRESAKPCPCGSRGCTKCKGGRGDY